MQERSPDIESIENPENSEERLVTPEPQLGDQYDQSLRPEQLRDYIGQKEIKENLEVFIGAAKKRGHALDHVLLSGPPGLGKTTLANELAPLLKAKRVNADEIRKAADDWDFSEEGRIRQSKRMAENAIKLKNEGNYVIADFICPTPEARNLFPADIIIWVDTIKEGRFDDTNQMFVKPEKYDFHVTSQDAKHWASKIIKEIE